MRAFACASVALTVPVLTPNCRAISRWSRPSMKWSRTIKNVSPLRRDFRELLTDDLRRFDHGHALLDAFLDGSRLEPAVGMRPELFRPDVAQTLPDPLRGYVDRLRLVRMHVDDPDRKLLREGIAIEQLEPAVAVVRHREVQLVDGKVEHLRVDRREVAVADVRDRFRRQTRGHDAHGLDRDLDLLGPCVDRGLVDLDVPGAGTLEVTGLVADDLRESEHRVAPRRIGLVVRPVEEGIRTGEHSLHRLRRQ